MDIHVKTTCIILKRRRNADFEKVPIIQQKNLFHYQQKISEHTLLTFDYQQNIYLSEPWNTKLRSV